MTLIEAIAAFRVLAEAKGQKHRAKPKPKPKPKARQKQRLRQRPKFKLMRKMGVKRIPQQPQGVPRELLEKAVQQWVLSIRAKTAKGQRSAMTVAMSAINGISKINRMPVKRIAAQVEAEAKRRLERK